MVIISQAPLYDRLLCRLFALVGTSKREALGIGRQPVAHKVPLVGRFAVRSEDYEFYAKVADIYRFAGVILRNL